MVGECVFAFQWHSRLGHPTLKIVRRVLSHFQLPVASPTDSIVCTACLGAKSKQLPFSSTTGSANCPLDLIYTDVWGPAPVNSSPVQSIMFPFLMLIANTLGFIQFP
jgi:hypothetical protein